MAFWIKVVVVNLVAIEVISLVFEIHFLSGVGIARSVISAGMQVKSDVLVSACILDLSARYLSHIHWDGRFPSSYVALPDWILDGRE